MAVPVPSEVATPAPPRFFRFRGEAPSRTAAAARADRRVVRPAPDDEDEAEAEADADADGAAAVVAVNNGSRLAAHQCSLRTGHPSR